MDEFVLLFAAANSDCDMTAMLLVFNACMCSYERYTREAHPYAGTPRPEIPFVHFDMDTYPEVNALEDFRFTCSELKTMSTLLNIPVVLNIPAMTGCKWVIYINLHQETQFVHSIPSYTTLFFLKNTNDLVNISIWVGMDWRRLSFITNNYVLAQNHK
jgi:hypothetical protein